MRRPWSFVLMFAVFITGTALAASVPQEPENDNPEYLLDIVTNRYSRWWREIYDSGDDRFRFRLGSNNVSQWFLEEELKLAAPLADRIRFRFHHARLFHYSTEEIGWDVLEFEGRVSGPVYFSVYALPTFDKHTSSLGLMLQHRQAVNEYAIISVEWPALLRNFSEHHRDTADSLLDVFTDQPVRIGLDLRERIIPNVWVRATGEYIPSFTMGEEVNATGQQIPEERSEGKALDGWVEYIIDPDRGVRDQMAFGVEAGYQRSRKSTDVSADPAGDVSFGGEPSRRLAGSPQLIPQEHFDDDLYEMTDSDTVSAWRDTRGFVAPYAWVPVGRRAVLNATLRYEEREISVGNDLGQTFDTSNHYLVPRVGASYALGDRRQYIVEGGYAAEFRDRKVEKVDGLLPRVTLSDNDYNDHRLYLAFDYVFGETNLIRLNESFELDCEDRGQFGIHDHGFFQMIIGF
jgi:hypothetical protein